MTERVVKVSLRAEINNYLSGMEQARRKTQETGTEAEKTAAKLQAQREAFNLIGGALLAAGTLAAAAVGVAVKKWMDFDQAMSAVAAATHESEENLGRLRDAALDAGARTVFSATEAANAIEELGKAGLSTQDILSGGLNGALDLAAAGGLEVADAAGIAAVAVKTFGLTGRDVSHVTDLLAAGAGKAMGDVQDLSQALSQGGQVAAATGLSIEETTAALAAFASQGLLGSDAGTAFKTMLQSLNPRSAEAAKLMRDLDISAYDAQGNFIGLEKFAGKLQKGLSGLTTQQRQAALATVFGSDAIRAATVLYSEGADGIREWERAVDDQGYAAETAALRLDNLKGDWEQFGGAVETAAIKAGEAADGPLRFLTQSATKLVEGFADAPAGVQQTALALGAVAAAAALSGGAFLVAVPKIAEYRAALATLGPTAQTASRIIGAAFKGLAVAGGIALAITALQTWLESMQATDEELQNLAATASSARDALQGSSKGLDVKWWREIKVGANDVRDALQQAADRSENFFAAAGQFDATATLDVLKEYGKGLGALAAVDLPRAQAGFRGFTEEYKLNATEQWRLLNQMPEYKDALTAQATALGLTADKTNLLKLAMGQSAPAAKESEQALANLEGRAASTEEAVDGLADAIRGFGSAQFDLNAATRQLEQAFDDLDEAVGVEGWTSTLDVAEQQGRDNQAALDGIAKAALEAAAATYVQTGSVESANAVISTQRDRLIGVLGQFGITGAAADTYADQLGLIPSNIATYAKFDADEAAVVSYRRAIESIPSYKNVQIEATLTGAKVMASDVFYKANGGVVEFYANGGTRRENHVAQIAPAGAWRVWAEPETGGEGYIPLAPSKRAGSVAVLGDIADRFGYGLVPKSATELASGAVMPPVYASGWGGSSSSGRPGFSQTNNFSIRTIDQDPLTQARVLGREFSRAVAG